MVCLNVHRGTYFFAPKLLFLTSSCPGCRPGHLDECLQRIQVEILANRSILLLRSNFTQVSANGKDKKHNVHA